MIPHMCKVWTWHVCLADKGCIAAPACKYRKRKKI